MDNYSLSDVAAVTRDNGGMFGGNGGMWIFALLVLCLLGNGGGFFGDTDPVYPKYGAGSDRGRPGDIGSAVLGKRG